MKKVRFEKKRAGLYTVTVDGKYFGAVEKITSKWYAYLAWGKEDFPTLREAKETITRDVNVYKVV